MNFSVGILQTLVKLVQVEILKLITQQAMNQLCEEYKDIFSLHQGDIVILNYLLWILIQEIILQYTKAIHTAIVAYSMGP